MTEFSADRDRLRQTSADGEVATFNADGTFSVKGVDGSVTEFSADERMLRRTAADGELTTFEYRGDQYVAKTGDERVLVGADGREIYSWVGDDESVRSVFSWNPDGSFSIKGPDGTVTEFTADRDPVRETSPDGEVTTF
ncbi:hypothetical protein ACLQ29_35420, partial [Micromonospora sp. DT228]|uniref:hypothetical protein n=1 Tax=Micromonospora sp. DT228 TaxID=3393443 RepID=UPI003CF72B92